MITATSDGYSANHYTLEMCLLLFIKLVNNAQLKAQNPHISGPLFKPYCQACLTPKSQVLAKSPLRMDIYNVNTEMQADNPSFRHGLKLLQSTSNLLNQSSISTLHIP